MSTAEKTLRYDTTGAYVKDLPKEAQIAEFKRIAKLPNTDPEFRAHAARGTQVRLAEIGLELAELMIMGIAGRLPNDILNIYKGPIDALKTAVDTCARLHDEAQAAAPEPTETTPNQNSN